MTTKPVYEDGVTKIAAADMNVIADCVWDALGEPTTPQEAVDNIGAAPAGHSHSEFSSLGENEVAALVYDATAGQTVLTLSTPDRFGRTYTLKSTEPFEKVRGYVQGLRKVRDDTLANGDFAVDPAANTVTFGSPLNLDDVVMLDVIAAIASTDSAVQWFDDTKAYDTSDYVVYNGQMYQATEPVAAGSFNALQWVAVAHSPITVNHVGSNDYQFDMTIEGADPSQPDKYIYTQGDLIIEASVTWSSGDPTTFVYRTSTDSGSNWVDAGTKTITYDGSMNVTATTWS